MHLKTNSNFVELDEPIYTNIQYSIQQLYKPRTAHIMTSTTTTTNHPAAVVVSSAAVFDLATTSSGGGGGGVGTTGTASAALNAEALYQIPVYAVILLLSVAGNALVILTLVLNRRMRTITNVFLLNLAVSDLLLGVLCMPITLVGALLRDFVFGAVMCKLMPYLQACSVSVSAWTLVAISCERYYAICHPLRSRRWQTLSHAYRSIALIWALSLALMSPIALLSQLIPTSHGHHKCREYWPEDRRFVERIFNVYLDAVLLVLPLLALATTYSLITSTMCKGMQIERVPTMRKRKPPAADLQRTSCSPSADNSLVEVYINGRGMASSRLPTPVHTAAPPAANGHSRTGQAAAADQQPVAVLTMLRKSNTEKHLRDRRRVIKMLFVVVLEFFLCWTPLYVINTLVLFEPELVYQKFGYTAISVCQLLAYSSSCCNPITYCFMNRGFRKAFAALFRWSRWSPKAIGGAASGAADLGGMGPTAGGGGPNGANGANGPAVRMLVVDVGGSLAPSRD